MLQIRKILHDPKQRVAFSSVVAAVFLIIIKLYVGLVTNSLGILSEALHSSLDFVAALITMLAVVSAGKPPDVEHHFGHGKSENISALVETILLLATCLWIFSEAIDRLFFSHSYADATIEAFATMAVSIIVDVSRSQVLYRAAKKYKSQALEADALHFSSDILSSSVVIVGLVLVHFGLRYGDPIGAIGVGILVLISSLRLGRRTLDYLMDKAPAGMASVVKKTVETVKGVKVERVRIRTAGSNQFVDLRISMDRRMPIASSQKVLTQIEEKVREVFADVDIVIQVEPRTVTEEDLTSRIILLAADEPYIRNVHNVIVHRMGKEISVDLHVEFNPTISIKQAHDIVSKYENRIKSELGVTEITTHIETREMERHATHELTDDFPSLVDKVKQIVKKFPEITECHDVSIKRAGGEVSLSIHCKIRPDKSVARAHDISTDLEKALKSDLMGIDYITIHIEPAD